MLTQYKGSTREKVIEKNNGFIKYTLESKETPEGYRFRVVRFEMTYFQSTNTKVLGSNLTKNEAIELFEAQ